MTMLLLAKQVLLYTHLIAFALALAEIVKGDWKLLREPALDIEALAHTAQLVIAALVALWITGLGLTFFDTGLDITVIATRPKLVAKFVVVVSLTANGGLLHAIAFPRLLQPARQPKHTARIAAMLGAVSTVSWLYAGFLGVGRIIAPVMDLEMFLGLYASALCFGMALALGVVAPLVETRLLRNALTQLMPQLGAAPTAAMAPRAAEPALAQPVLVQPVGRRRSNRSA